MEITLHRGEESGNEPRLLPAETYNTARILLAQGNSDCVFVPIRSMQYLAVIDAEEIVFVNGERKGTVEIAWTGFRPQQRESLADAVPYVARYYRPDGADTMQRLQGEFALALRALYRKQAGTREADILPFSARRGEG